MLTKLSSIPVLFILFFICPLYSQETNQDAWYLEQDLGGEYNPLGLQLDTKLYYEFALQKTDNFLFKTSKVDAGLIDRISPSYECIGVTGYVEPIAFFDFTFTGLYQYAYNIFGYGFLSENSSDALNFAPPTEAGGNAQGWWIIAAPRLKMQLGNFIAADTFSYNYLDKLNYSGYYYESFSDAIVSASDYYWINDGYLLYQVTKTITVGINDYNLFVPDTGYVSHRISAVFIFEPDLKPFSDFYIFCSAGTLLIDHYYVGKICLIAAAGYKLMVF